MKNQQSWVYHSTGCRLVGVVVGLLVESFVLGQHPVSNPTTADVKDHASSLGMVMKVEGGYGKHRLTGNEPSLGEWTNGFRWTNVRNARTVSRLMNVQNVVDSTVFAATVQALAAEGGVLYFPAGMYQFNFDLILPAGIVLRGADRRDSLPVTHFQFAKFNPSAKQPAETSVPKKITLQAGAKGTIGLVNLDINRAYVDFRSSRSGQYLSNVLLFGIRINNAAALNSAIPTTYQRTHHRTWQRWPDPQTGCINLAVERNVLIAHCRINDQPTDSYRQNGYLIDDGMIFDGSQAMFRFTDHAGIVFKTPRRPTNIQIVENVVQVTAGNPAIVATTGRLDLQSNREMIIPEKQNIVYDGIHARQMDYTRLYNHKKGSEAKQFTSDLGDTLAYRLIKPDQYNPAKKYPLVLFFHDYDEIGTDNRAQLRQFIWQLTTPEAKTNFPCFIVAPQLPPTEKRWRSEGFSSNTWALQTSAGLLDELAKTYAIDGNRIYVIGINAGGEAAWDIAIRYPQKFAAVVPLASFYRFSPHSVRQLRSIPIWTFFGDSDEWFGKLTKQGIKSDLKAAGLNFRMTELPDTGHRCWNGLVEAVPEFLPWLFTRKKG